MNLMYPDVSESDAAREGTAAHEIAEELARAEGTASLGSGRGNFVGKLSESGVAYTDEMYDAAGIYAETVSDIMQGAMTFGGPFVRIEKSVPIHSVHPKCFGTPDFWLFDTNGVGTLHIVDFKYGFGAVEAFENWQLITYCSGVVRELGLTVFDIDKINVNLWVVQPRAFHHEGPVRVWRTDVHTLKPFFETLRVSAEMAMSKNARTRSGSHCKDCQALSVCPSAQNAAMNAVDTIDQIRIDSSVPEAVSNELRVLKRASDAVAYRMSALETRISEEIKNGVVHPHFALESGQGRKKWNIPASDLISIGDASGVNLRKDSAVLTPNQAIKAGLPVEMVTALSDKIFSDNKLTKINHNKAREVFA